MGYEQSGRHTSAFSFKVLCDHFHLINGIMGADILTANEFIDV